ncbi:hypothetical protein L596_007417 [Steinernema carpocapsae]|uniref:Uncharacterized protein n=1 Tax=Steinernema carpocapsae TaxID=34508 RepID=A0A4U5P9A8_STECR|nr:hypothetical protein L596_007417 [Steinernema carpocapsae]
MRESLWNHQVKPKRITLSEPSLRLFYADDDRASDLRFHSQVEQPCLERLSEFGSSPLRGGSTMDHTEIVPNELAIRFFVDAVEEKLKAEFYMPNPVQIAEMKLRGHREPMEKNSVVVEHKNICWALREHGEWERATKIYIVVEVHERDDILALEMSFKKLTYLISLKYRNLTHLQFDMIDWRWAMNLTGALREIRNLKNLTIGRPYRVMEAAEGSCIELKVIGEFTKEVAHANALSLTAISILAFLRIDFKFCNFLNSMIQLKSITLGQVVLDFKNFRFFQFKSITEVTLNSCGREPREDFREFCGSFPALFPNVNVCRIERYKLGSTHYDIVRSLLEERITDCEVIIGCYGFEMDGFVSSFCSDECVKAAFGMSAAIIKKGSTECAEARLFGVHSDPQGVPLRFTNEHVIYLRDSTRPTFSK